MYVSDLALHNFRSYEDQVVSLSPGVNVIVGFNGVGKTNVVEALGYLSTLHSHRVANDQALIHVGKDKALVRTKVVNNSRALVLEMEFSTQTPKAAKINKGKVKPRELLGIIKSVLFAPEDIDLVRSDPSGRRNFIDDIIFQLRPHLAEVKSDYEKILKQRSALLKRAGSIIKKGKKVDLSALDVWNQQLARNGAVLISARAKIIENLRPFVNTFYQEVSKSTSVARIDYLCSLEREEGTEISQPLDFAISEQTQKENDSKRLEQEKEIQKEKEVFYRFIEVIKKIQPKEIERGQCLVGPHRDDLRLVIGKHPAKGFASHGESWSYALALRLAQWQVLRREEEPILMLDDVFAEIDNKRRNQLAKLVKEAEQVIITAAVFEDLPEIKEAKIFKVTPGKISLEIKEKENFGEE